MEIENYGVDRKVSRSIEEIESWAYVANALVIYYNARIFVKSWNFILEEDFGNRKLWS